MGNQGLDDVDMLKQYSYFKTLTEDVLYLRVYTVLTCLLFGTLFGLPLLLIRFQWSIWSCIGVGLLVVIELFILWVIGVAIFANARSFRRLVDEFDLSGADLVGELVTVILFVLIGIIAVPITMVLRGFR